LVLQRFDSGQSLHFWHALSLSLITNPALALFGHRGATTG
jgi:hypothetical protein